MRPPTAGKRLTQLRTLLLALNFTLFAQIAAAQEDRPVRRSAEMRSAAITQAAQAAVRQQVVATYVPAPESRRIPTQVVRNGVNLIEMPFVSVAAEERLALILSVRADPGLRCTRRGCGGVVRIGLNDSARVNDRITLPVPMPVEIYGLDSVAPEMVTIATTHTLTPIRVHTIGQSAVLRVRPVGLPEAEIPLPVQMGTLGMSLASGSIDRFGLESTTLNIGPVEGLDPTDTIAVRLEAVGARVDPSVVHLTGRDVQSVKVRSRSASSGTVKAIGPPYVNTQPVNVKMTLPWLFVLFSLLGGLAGGFVRQTFFGAKGSRQEKVNHIIASALAGFVLTLLLVLGFNLSGVPLPIGDSSEVAGFATTGLLAAIADVILSMRRNAGTQSTPDMPQPSEQ
ncbi:MAG TPA: hypothetical protein VGD27_14545 [Longimicrobiales bacterium]